MKIKNLNNFGFKTKNRTYVIAEIGINHGGDLDLAKRLIKSASETGVDAVKFQTYITEKRAPSGNKAIFDILKRCELPFEAFQILKNHAAAEGLDFFSTPFDRESVEYLDSIDVDLFKIASFDVVNIQLLKNIAKFGKPIIMSLGMANQKEIDNAYKILKQGTDKIALLHCVSGYPITENQANLSAIYELQGLYDCIIGYSDHTSDITVPLIAVSAGAQIIEKHFRLDEEMECVDAAVSITQAQTKKLVQEIRRLEDIFGDGDLGLREVEKKTAIFRRFSS